MKYLDTEINNFEVDAYCAKNDEDLHWFNNPHTDRTQIILEIFHHTNIKRAIIMFGDRVKRFNKVSYPHLEILNGYTTWFVQYMGFIYVYNEDEFKKRFVRSDKYENRTNQFIEFLKDNFNDDELINIIIKLSMYYEVFRYDDIIGKTKHIKYDYWEPERKDFLDLFGDDLKVYSLMEIVNKYITQLINIMNIGNALYIPGIFEDTDSIKKDIYDMFKVYAIQMEEKILEIFVRKLKVIKGEV